MATTKDAESLIDGYIATPKESVAPDVPAKTDEQTVTDAAAKSGETEQTSVEKTAKGGNTQAQKLVNQDKSTKDADKERQQAEEDAQKKAQAEEDAQKNSLSDTLDAPAGLARRSANWIANAPTPGGIGVLLLALFFFLWAIVPVNSAGDTRLKLLWFTLNGKTEFKPSETTVGGSADFGPQGTGDGTQTTQTEPVNVPVLPLSPSPFED